MTYRLPIASLVALMVVSLTGVVAACSTGVPAVGDCVAIESGGAFHKVGCDSDTADYRLTSTDTNAQFTTNCKDAEEPLRITERDKPFGGVGFCGERLSSLPPVPTPTPGPAVATVLFDGETVPFDGGSCDHPFETWLVFSAGSIQGSEYFHVTATDFRASTAHWDLTMRHKGVEAKAFFELSGTISQSGDSGTFDGHVDLEGLKLGNRISGSFTC